MTVVGSGTNWNGNTRIGRELKGDINNVTNG